MGRRSKKTRKLFNQNYYKAQAMLRDFWFQEKSLWLIKRFTEVGCPLPKRPFKKYKSYLAWNDRFWRRFADMERSPEYVETRNKITGGKDRISAGEYRALEDFRNQFLPPIYGTIFTEILEHYNIDHNDKGFRDFLESYFFLGKKEFSTPPFGITLRRNNETNEIELFLRIYGYTKKEDLVRHWDWIAQEQKYLKSFVGKNKAWQTVDRDLEVYSAYKKITGSGVKRQKICAADKTIFIQLHQKYPGLTIGNIRMIVSKTRKRLGEI